MFTNIIIYNIFNTIVSACITTAKCYKIKDDVLSASISKYKDPISNIFTKALYKLAEAISKVTPSNAPVDTIDDATCQKRFHTVLITLPFIVLLLSNGLIFNRDWNRISIMLILIGIYLLTEMSVFKIIDEVLRASDMKWAFKS